MRLSFENYVKRCIKTVSNYVDIQLSNEVTPMHDELIDGVNFEFSDEITIYYDTYTETWSDTGVKSIESGAYVVRYLDEDYVMLATDARYLKDLNLHVMYNMYLHDEDVRDKLTELNKYIPNDKSYELTEGLDGGSFIISCIINNCKVTRSFKWNDQDADEIINEFVKVTSILRSENYEINCNV